MINFDEIFTHIESPPPPQNRLGYTKILSHRPKKKKKSAAHYTTAPSPTTDRMFTAAAIRGTKRKAMSWLDDYNTFIGNMYSVKNSQSSDHGTKSHTYIYIQEKKKRKGKG